MNNVSDNPDTVFSGFNLDEAPHEQGDVDLLLRLYIEKRLKSQADFYESRIRENQKNSDFTFNVATLIMTVSSLCATISASIDNDNGLVNLLTVASAVLPAFAALLAAFRQLYGWDRQVLIYRDTLLGLERSNLLVPDDDRLSRADIMDIFPKLVMASEDVFAGEAAQWGQFVLAKPEEEIRKDNLGFDQMLADINLTEEQMAAIRAIVGAGGRQGVTISTQSEQTKVLTAGMAGEEGEAEFAPQVEIHQTTHTSTDITLPPTMPPAEPGGELEDASDESMADAAADQIGGGESIDEPEPPELTSAG